MLPERLAGRLRGLPRERRGRNREPSACVIDSQMEEYARLFGITIEVAARTSPHSFQVLRRRWVAERTLGWLMRYRRLARDCERRPEHHEAKVWWATAFIMTKRLARNETGQPDPPRWAGERPRPAQQAALSTGSMRHWAEMGHLGEVGTLQRR